MGVSPSLLIVIEVRAVVEHFIGHAVDGEGNEGELWSPARAAVPTHSLGGETAQSTERLLNYVPL